MKKVLIVDDEILSIEYMKRLTAWEKYDCSHIDSAWISSKALDCFRKEKHEIVFMDIRMPGVDGLTLSREFLKIAPETIIVIMTAWQEFEYVKEAMQIGIKHFLVKHEITEEKLDEVLLKIMEDIRLRESYQNALWNNWLRTIWENREDDKIPEKGKQSWFMILITLRGLPMLLGGQEEKYISEEQIREVRSSRITIQGFSRLEKFSYGLFCAYTPTVSQQSQQEDIQEFLNRVRTVCMDCTDLHPVFFVSGIKSNTKEFVGLCKILKQFAQGVLWKRREVIYEQEFGQYVTGDLEWFPAKNPEEWDRTDLQRLLNEDFNKTFITELTGLNLIRKFLRRRIELSFLQTQEEKMSIISLEQLLRAALCFLENGSMHKGTITQQALEYIREHYSEDISSTVIAEAIQVSEGYLRMVFKKELSSTVKEYILQYRIERSKELLQSDGKKIYEIAAQCGFMSSQHFSRVFRQVTGMTPGEYKQR